MTQNFKCLIVICYNCFTCSHNFHILLIYILSTFPSIDIFMKYFQGITYCMYLPRTTHSLCFSLKLLQAFLISTTFPQPPITVLLRAEQEWELHSYLHWHVLKREIYSKCPSIFIYEFPRDLNSSSLFVLLELFSWFDGGGCSFTACNNNIG